MQGVGSSHMHTPTVYRKVIMCVCCVNAGRGFKSHAYTHSVQEGHHVCVCAVLMQGVGSSHMHTPTVYRKVIMCVCCVNAGRGFKSHAYTHSVQEGHHVFLNLETMKFYCLPDNYHIIDQSLEDIVVSHSSDFHLSVSLSLCLSLCLSVSLSL